MRGETDPPGDGEDEPDGPEGGETDPPGDEPEGPNERPPIGEGPEIVQSPTDSIMEVPPINPGDYPELYARRKNLVGGDVEALDRESERVRDEMAENVGARINNYRLENPGATLEQIRQFAMQCYVEAQNELQEDVIAAIDGQGYEDVNGEIKGRSRLRRFGAWMDRHGSKLKKGLLAAGAVGAVALTAGVAAGVIVPAFAIGAGTAIGAAKGAAVGLGMSRHGSKESVSRNIDVTSESYQELFAEMDPQSMRDYTKIADYLMLHYNASADKDHSLNVKKSGTAAAIGAVLGGLAGSISFNSLETSSSHTTTQVPNDPPDIPHHTIQPNELTGQVIDKTLGDMGIDASNFVNPDGSTNLQAIFDIVPKDQWISMQELANHTHSVAGADNLSNEGIRSIIETIVNNHDWGTHSVTQSQITQQLVNNLPFTIAGWVSGGALAAGASRAAADLTKSNSATRAPEVERFDEAEERESGNEPAPLRNGGRYSPPVPQRGEGGSDGGNASSPERRGERPETAEDWERTVNRSIASGDNGALRHVAELERRGYVERLPEDADSNGVQPVRLTDEGRRRLGLR